MSGGGPSVWQLLVVSSALGPLLLFGANLFFYRRPGRQPAASEGDGALPRVSVLIPARNEEAGIAEAVSSVLASQGVALELIVLDDASVDRTAEIVSTLSLGDARVQAHCAPALPEGWNGKQHACSVLAAMAREPWLCFLDADVRLAPDALERLVAYAERTRLDLLSGFPQEETGSWLERLLIPLVHFMLLCYLPLAGAQMFPRAGGFSAGCGQLMLVRRTAYQASGGHAAIRQTMHDGILLPRLLRQSRFRTGLADFTLLATCRMYRSASEVWCGLGKNATEGMAAPARIVPFTAMLLLGQVLPVLWLAAALAHGQPLLLPAAAVGCGYAVRVAAVLRFRQSVRGALLHPAGVAVLLALQWWSLGRKVLGRPAVWKQRAYTVG